MRGLELSRPKNCRLDYQHPLCRGLQFGMIGFGAGNTMAWDSSPARRHGTLIGYGTGANSPSAMWGRANGSPCLSFDGTDDAISLTMPALDTFSFSGWVNAKAWINYCMMFYVGGTGNGFRMTGVGSPGKMNVRLGEVTLDSSLTTVPAIGVWFHAACVRSRDNTVRYYLNGRDDTPPTPPSSSVLLSTSWLLGSDSGNSRVFQGRLANVLIHNRPLSPAEIWTLYSDPVMLGGLIVGEVERTYVMFGRMASSLLMLRRRMAA